MKWTIGEDNLEDMTVFTWSLHVAVGNAGYNSSIRVLGVVCKRQCSACQCIKPHTHNLTVEIMSSVLLSVVENISCLDPDVWNYYRRSLVLPDSSQVQLLCVGLEESHRSPGNMPPNFFLWGFCEACSVQSEGTKCMRY